MSEVIRGQVGEEVEHLITNIRNEDGELATGDVLRRTCKMFGEGACKQECQVMSGSIDNETTIDLLLGNPMGCSDTNLAFSLEANRLPADQVLMVSVTGNEVGFADQAEDYSLRTNKSGWHETAGFNAFFARGSEYRALGCRLADCAHISFEFKDDAKETVMGFQHGTRTNMFGEQQFAFELDGEEVSYTEYVLGAAIQHYGANPQEIKIKLASAIRAENFIKHFKSHENMEEHLPGWLEAGYLRNVTNPEWRSDDPVDEDDVWEADSRGMTIDDIKRAMERFGIPEANFDMEGIIDPADTRGAHSSHELSTVYGESRDLYLTFIRASAGIQRLQQAKRKGEELLTGESQASETFGELKKEIPDAAEMIFASDAGLRGQELVDYWDNIGLGEDGFYDDIRKNGCSSCGCHTPGCCDGCA